MTLLTRALIIGIDYQKEGKHMSNEEYRNLISEMIGRIQSESLLRRIYLMIVVIMGSQP